MAGSGPASSSLGRKLAAVPPQGWLQAWAQFFAYGPAHVPAEAYRISLVFDQVSQINISGPPPVGFDVWTVFFQQLEQIFCLGLAAIDISLYKPGLGAVDLGTVGGHSGRNSTGSGLG
jgi:hypothetical protein